MEGGKSPGPANEAFHKYQPSETLSTGHPNLRLVIRSLHFAKTICIDRYAINLLLYWNVRILVASVLTYNKDDIIVISYLE